MSRKDFSEPMPGARQEIKFDGQMSRELDRELKHAERKTCDEKSDIRTMGIKGEPFTPSGQKVADRIIRSSEKPRVSQDAQLHADTTEPNENVVMGFKKGGFTNSAQENFSRQKDKKVPDAVKRTTFNS